MELSILKTIRLEWLEVLARPRRYNYAGGIFLFVHLATIIKGY